MSVDPAERGPGAVLRVPLPGGRWGMAQVIAVTPRVVSVCLADAVWDCAPAALDWQHAGRAIPHMAIRPEGLSNAEVVGLLAPDPEAQAAHAAWQSQPAGQRPVSPAPLVALIAVLLT